MATIALVFSRFRLLDAGLGSSDWRVKLFAAWLVVACACLACGSGEDAPTATPSIDASAEGAPLSDATKGDATPVDASSAAPLVAPANETWTWVDVPGTACANGAPTGVGVNFTGKSNDVLVFLEGGGACWDGATCYGGQSVATYLTGYGATEFATDPQRVLFSTTRDASNPFRDMNMIYVPYCTGDVHAGHNVVVYNYLGVDHPTHHVGGDNLAIVLARVAATFPSAPRVWIAGDSAGGFGAALSVTLARATFPKATLGILDDSGQPIPPAPDRWSAWKAAWKLETPPDCAACATDPSAYVHYYQTSHPDVTFGLLSYDPDPVIATFMGLSLSQFSSELLATRALVDQPGARTKYFVALGSSHVVMTTATPALTSWMQQMVDGSPSWASEHP